MLTNIMATTPESTIFLKLLSSNHLTVIISFQRGKINYRKTLPEKKKSNCLKTIN